MALLESKVLKITLPDGNTLELAEGATTLTVAEQIGPGLARAAVAGRYTIDGQTETIDLNRPLPDDCSIEILTKSDDSADSLYVLRHSTAHVMAEAICKLYPAAQLVYGPPLEDGFYYDIDLDESLTPDAFERIEAEMKRIVKEDRPFSRYDMSRDEAMTKLAGEKNRYKVDNAERAEGDTLSFYITGERRGEDFEDLCRGPHIRSTGQIGAFKVRQLSAAYYRGDANEKSLQRVYGTAFYKKKALKEHLHRLEEAKKRDHRVIGRQLDLFHIDEAVGQGLVLWMPAGSIVRKELQDFISDELRKQGYQEVFTPHIGKLDLYRTSGHVPYYEDSQFPHLLVVRDHARPLVKYLRECRDGNTLPDADRERELVRQANILEAEYPWEEKNSVRRYAIARELSMEGTEQCSCAQIAHHYASGGGQGFLLKPMNCPHHIKIFASRPHSYRDLPVRLAEFGTVYRWEQSGELNGMTRVRGFTQDDAHLFCTPEQVPEELANCLHLVRLIFTTLGITEYRVRVGLRDRDSDKFMGDEAKWDMAEQACRDAAKVLGVPFSEEVGEGAFYGPKIDFIVKDCLGREWQLGTVQVDPTLPERFGLNYVGSDNQEHRPVMIHRAPFGSMERFVGILIEHFAGAIPLWLSPVQVAVLTISEKSVEFGRKVHRVLADAGIRVELDDSDERIGPKKHDARAKKVPYLLVIGEREAAEGTVNVNNAEGKMLGSVALEEFVRTCLDEIETKSMRKLESPDACSGSGDSV